MTQLRHAKRKTIKPHRCFGCSRLIKAGTTMHYLVSHDSANGFQYGYMCTTCYKYCMGVLDPNDEFSAGDLPEDDTWEEIRAKEEDEQYA